MIQYRWLFGLLSCALFQGCDDSGRPVAIGPPDLVRHAKRAVHEINTVMEDHGRPERVPYGVKIAWATMEKDGGANGQKVFISTRLQGNPFVYYDVKHEFLHVLQIANGAPVSPAHPAQLFGVPISAFGVWFWVDKNPG